MDNWSQTPSKLQAPFSRADRSMSLTESSYVPPPPGFAPLCSPVALPSARYKTELCRGFQERGICKYGAKCQFAHGEAELRGLNRHPKYKTEACRTFYHFGYCPYGARCHFIHEEKLTPLTAKFQNQNPGPNPRHQLRQSVSFAGFMASPGSPSPPTFQESQGFTRAHSVSPPPADLLSPALSNAQRHSFSFGPQQYQPAARASVGDIHTIPLVLEAPRCVCSHGKEPPCGKPAGLQRFSSEDSLSDRDSSSSGTSSSSRTQSPDMEGAGGKRLTVFTRLSVSD
ncbi:mRNA decay activator protein ZFP36 [Aplochiton taeniatus]